MNELLKDASERAARYLAELDKRPVVATAAARAALSGFDQPLPDAPTDPAAVLALLDETGSPATTANAGGRYFGFVTGGTLPAALAASWLATTWDNNGGLNVMSPTNAKLEEVALGWLVDLFDLPAETAGGFVTGATMANFTALAAARHALLARQGWDVEAKGLFGAPALQVVVGDEVHVSVLKALGLLGLGRERVIRVPVDDQGRMRADALPTLDAQTLVIAQAGNVNTGAIDPLDAICTAAQAADAWVHADGAFGMWAAVSPNRAHLTAGLAEADSWATDAHKWLNTPYDSGLVFCRHTDALREAMTMAAAYLAVTDLREPYHYTPEMSRRARGVEVWTALYSLGRLGVAALIERCCQHATRFAEGLTAAGYEVLNDVVLNQVLVAFGDDEETRRVLAAVQEEGTCWCGGTVWQGRAAMRISVSSWATTGDDVEQSLAAIVRVASGVKSGPYARL